MNLTECTESEYFDQSLYTQWINVSTFNSTSELSLYICEYKKYTRLSDGVNRVLSYIYIISSIFGLLSSILSIITLWANDHFDVISYSYFRMIAWLEIIHHLYLFDLGLHTLLMDIYLHIFGWNWFMEIIGEALANASSTAVDFMVIFLSLERAAACISPKIFNRINQKIVAVSVCVGTTVVSFLLHCPLFFASKLVRDPALDEYSITSSNFGNSPFFISYALFLDSLWFFTAACMFVTSVLVIGGMLKWLERKRRLLKQVNPNPGQGPDATDDASRQTSQLCYLQLSQALPTLINYIFCTVTDIGFPLRDIGYVAISSGASFETALHDLHSSYPSLWLLVLQNTTDCMAHCFHFYLYYLLSRRFREGVHERFGKKHASAPAISASVESNPPARRQPMPRVDN